MPRRPKHFSYIALKGPDFLWKQREKLPVELQDVPVKQRALIAALVAEHGGPAKITTAKCLLIGRIAALWAYVELMDRWAWKDGNPLVQAEDGRWTMIAPQEYALYSNSLVRGLKALRELADNDKNAPVIDLKTYLEGRAAGDPGVQNVSNTLP